MSSNTVDPRVSLLLHARGGDCGERQNFKYGYAEGGGGCQTVLWNRNILIRFRLRIGKDLVPVPVPSRQYLSHFPNNKKCIQKSHFLFIYFFITFYVGSGSKSGSGHGTETVMHFGHGSAETKKLMFLRFRFHNALVSD